MNNTGDSLTQMTIMDCLNATVKRTAFLNTKCNDFFNIIQALNIIVTLNIMENFNYPHNITVVLTELRVINKIKRKNEILKHSIKYFFQ